MSSIIAARESGRVPTAPPDAAPPAAPAPPLPLVSAGRLPAPVARCFNSSRASPRSGAASPAATRPAPAAFSIMASSRSYPAAITAAQRPANTGSRARSSHS